MARNYAQIVTSVWADPDWLELSPEAQRMYLVLLTQPKLTMVGSLDRMPRRWATYAKGMTVEMVEDALAELEAGRYVLVDHDVEELVIRTFVRNDGSARSATQRASMWGAWEGLASEALKAAVLDELPDKAWDGPNDRGVGGPPEAALALRDTPSQQAPEPPSDISSDTPSDTPTDGATDTPRKPLTLNLTPDPGSRSNPIVEQAPPATTSLALVAEHAEETKPDPVQQIFEAWKASTGKSKAKLDTKRRRVILAALKSYPVEDLLDAVDGWRHSPHHRGENERQTVYNEIDLLLRDARRIEQFRDLARDGAPRPVSQAKGMAAVQRFAQRHGVIA